MPVQVVLFSYLAEATGGERRVLCAGPTVRAVLTDLTRRYPGLAGKVCDAQGGLSRALVLYLSGRALVSPEELDSPVAEGDEIVLLPATAGG